ncbi:hypothetical protein [Aureispira anguillae]|uniref:Uncharacterized protein n=1 Tax=Aureispira anguillae TaxID=2864201 RepID=A0A916DTE6_9BACT|nr:hypothetical protein [Aureispira anguillae]BDS11800.1 hypothetical protein AsAng_0025140 [Aureispira anguillae]
MKTSFFFADHALYFLFFIIGFFPQSLYGQQPASTQHCPVHLLQSFPKDVTCFQKSDGEIALSYDSSSHINCVKLIKQIGNTNEYEGIRSFTPEKKFNSLASGSYRIICQLLDSSLCHIETNIKAKKEVQIKNFHIEKAPNSVTNEKGTITIEVDGGTKPYTLYLENTRIQENTTHQFSLGASKKNISRITSGTQILRVSDTHGCGNVDTVVHIKDALNFYSKKGSNQRATCNAKANFSVVFNNNNPSETNNFVITTVRIDQNKLEHIVESRKIFPPTGGTYFVPVQEIGRYHVSIRQGAMVEVHTFDHKLAKKPQLDVQIIDHPKLQDLSGGKIKIEIKNPESKKYTYAIHQQNTIVFNQTLETTAHTVQDLQAGFYSITVSDENGCKAIASSNQVKYLTTLSRATAQENFKKDMEQNQVDFVTCQCHRDRLERSRQIISITLASIGVTTSVLAAALTAGALTAPSTIAVIGIVGGSSTLASPIVREAGLKAKVALYEEKLNKIAEIKTLYNKLDTKVFAHGHWGSKEEATYNKLIEEISVKTSALTSDKKLSQLRLKCPRLAKKLAEAKQK